MISIILIILAGIANAAMDKVKSHFNRSIFYRYDHQFFNPQHSWKNKWKPGTDYKVEKFFGSSTIFVFITDFWHLAQFFMLKFFFLAIVLYKPIIHPLADFVILHTAFNVVFELFFSKIFEK